MASEFNWKGVSICIGAILILVALCALILSAGCVTATKNTYSQLTATPVPTPTPVPPTPEPTPTPTPAPTLSPQQILEQTGGLWMGQTLSWHRDNVSGYKKMDTHVSVYDYRMFGSVQWHSVSWGTNTYFREGAGDGRKFLFVFVNSYSDQNSSRMWGIQPSQFWVNIKGTLYQPTEVLQPEIRIKEFDDILTTDESGHKFTKTVKPYGYLRVTDSKGRESTEALGFLKAGKSNAWDGYIVYIIPSDTQPEDIRVIGTFGSLIDSHYWQLTDNGVRESPDP